MINAYMYIPLLGPIDLPLNCRATILTHKTGFLRVIYAILNASVILERNKKCLERNEKCLERNETRLTRNETRLARNETRGGNLLLGGTVHLKKSLYSLVIEKKNVPKNVKCSPFECPNCQDIKSL